MSESALDNRVRELPEAHDRRYFAELVIELERRIDVNSITIGSLRIWPLLRWQLARNVKAFKSESNAARRQQVKTRLALARSQSAPRGWMARRLAKIFRRAGTDRGMALFMRRSIDAQLDALQKVGKVDYVVASKTEKYYQQIGDRQYAPITDPVYEDLTRYGRVVPLALEPIDFVCVHTPVRIDIEPHMWLTRRMPKPHLPALNERIEEINSVLRDVAPQYYLDADRVIDRYARYMRKEQYFHRVFEILRPKIVFYSSFTGWTPLTWACRNLGIPTVDIQHGGQGPYHYLTTHWTRVPKEGYELMPDYFWCWSEENRRFIEPWLPGGAQRHVPLVGGNRHVAKWRRSGESLLSPEERAYLSMLRESPKVVLVTLGYSVEEILPAPLLDAVRSLPNCTWLFRLHPLHRGASVRSALQRSLQEVGISDAEVEMPTRMRLHALLSVAHHHVTPFSTAGREALAFGVPTLIVHPIGKTYFSEEIAEGTFQYADTTDGIVKHLGSASPMTRSPDARYIQSDDALVDDVVRRIHRDYGYELSER